MRFARPDVLWATLLVMPMLGAFLWWTWRERQRLITQFVQSRLLAILTVGVSRQRQKLRLWLVALAVAATMIALSRPQWGYGYQEVKQRGLDILIAIDTSRSMLAEDTLPNRLARAKLAALDLRRLAKTDRLGLIAFAGSAFLQMPLSTDEDAFRQNLDALDSTLLPQGGTALAEAIQSARAAFKEAGQENHRALVLFTDGEDHDGEAVAAAKAAAKEGLSIFTVGIGTAKGEILAIRDNKGRMEFIKDENGNAVKSRLNESLLQDIAKAGDGFYLPLSGAKTMETLFEQGLAPLPKMEHKATLMRQYFERFQWFLALAWILLIAEMFIPDRKPAAKPPAPVTPLAGSGRTRAAALLAIGLLAITAFLNTVEASPSEARKNYESGKFKNALNEYERLTESNPNDSRLRYNAGAAAYQAGKFDKAQEHFASALATSDPKLQQQAYYNLGNTRFRLGQDSQQPQQAQELWQKAIEDYQTSLKLNPSDTDAQHNLEFVKKQLEALKQQQQQQKQSGDSKDKNQDNDKDKNKDQNQDKKQDDKSDSSQNSQDKDSQKDQKQEEQNKDSKDPKKEGGEKKDQDASQPSNDPKDQQSKSGKEDKESKDQGEKNGSSAAQDERQDPKDKAGEGAPRRVIQMSKQEAIQLLEALRSEERLLRPPPSKTNRVQRTLKDW